MPIEVDATDGPATGPTASPRPVSPAACRPPGLLLRPGGHADLRSAAERLLALDALRLAHLLGRARRPGRWRGAAFGRHVDLVRMHLAPIHDAELLAASFGREAMHAGRTRPGTFAETPERAAYAVRWLELRDGVRFGPWHEIVAGSVPT